MSVYYHTNGKRYPSRTAFIKNTKTDLEMRIMTQKGEIEIGKTNIQKIKCSFWRRIWDRYNLKLKEILLDEFEDDLKTMKIRLNLINQHCLERDHAWAEILTWFNLTSWQIKKQTGGYRCSHCGILKRQSGQRGGCQ